MAETKTRFSAPQKKRRILIIEDEEINREILGTILSDDYEIASAETGAHAIELVDSLRATLSLILLDLHLPDASGLDLLRRFKGDAQTARIPVIVLTADTEAEVECLTLGAIDFIPKPYPQPKVIQARVLRTIELSEDKDIIRSTERDGLTGLYNKEFFFRYAAQLDAFHREMQADAMVVNINHFRMLNERYGRAYGDEVLKSIGEKLRSCVAEDGGIVCRQYGDSFLVYSPHRTDYMEVLNRAAEGLDSRVRIRMGVYPNVDKHIDLARRFDRAKMAADTVRNSFTKVIAVYDETLHESEMFAEQLLEDFDRAIEEKQFTVFYQPKFDIRPETPVLNSAEALVRWRHPRLGMINPGVFVPLFESNGLITQLDSYVWRETAAQLREWKERLGIIVPVSVNVSRVDMFDGDLVERMCSLLRENGLTPEEFLLEITESAYTEDSRRIVEIVDRLRSAGFRIEMDDFGSGYSSLNMISTLPVDALKLDMQFMRNSFKDRRNTKMLHVVFEIAETLEVPTIAEGVETAEQLHSLREMGCDIVQGYYFSRPVPPEEFERFLLERKALMEQD